MSGKNAAVTACSPITFTSNWRRSSAGGPNSAGPADRNPGFIDETGEAMRANDRAGLFDGHRNSRGIGHIELQPVQPFREFCREALAVRGAADAGKHAVALGDQPGDAGVSDSGRGASN